ncbi:MAG: hydroxymethylglutaryl-CoA reductase, degradative, partial [Weissella confusa]|nr:hydroxymethylglutaryl-CoA reductase, degradative [Weissella confusa]
MADWHGFYKLSWRERLDKTIENKQLTAEQVALIEAQYDAVGEQQVENYLYNFGVPTGLLPDLPVDGRLVTVPMSTEEPSVIAAASNGA